MAPCVSNHMMVQQELSPTLPICLATWFPLTKWSPALAGIFPFKLIDPPIASTNIVLSGWTTIANFFMVISKKLLPLKRRFNPKKPSKTLQDVTMSGSNISDQTMAFLPPLTLANMLKHVVNTILYVVLVPIGKMASPNDTLASSPITHIQCFCMLWRIGPMSSLPNFGLSQSNMLFISTT